MTATLTAEPHPLGGWMVACAQPARDLDRTTIVGTCAAQVRGRSAEEAQEWAAQQGWTTRPDGSPRCRTCTDGYPPDVRPTWAGWENT